ncbi:MAG: efflux RND transporter permease subunit, partial [Planctomycetota bacterium]
MIRYFAQHPTAANLLMIALMAIGLLTLRDLRRETMPDFAAAEVEVRVPYPGAAAEDIEESVCARVEEAIDGIDGIEEVRSEAREGLGRIVVRMQEGQDMAAFLADVKREVDAIDDLPDQAEPPIVSELGFLDLVVSIAVSGEGVEPQELKRYCEDLKDRLRFETGIRLVNVKGFSDQQLRVELSAEALQQYGLSIEQVADTIGGQSLDLPVGTLLADEREVLLRFRDERRSPRELAGLVIVSNATGGEVRLGEIATIRSAFEVDEQRVTIDGRRAGLLEIEKTKSEDALDVFAAVTAFVEAEAQRKPPGIELTLTQDVASVVEDRLLMLVKNGWQGMRLVVMALTLFFSPRFSFWVAFGIPVSFLGALFFMQQLGLTINMITMVGLLLALGLLMDDAMVLAENIAAHRQRGRGAFDSAVEGTREVGVGVVSSFVTTCMIFGPLAFIEGDIGKVLRVMPMVLILVLAISLIEAFMILPNHLSHSLDPPGSDRRGPLRRASDTALEWARETLLGRTVDWVVRWRYLSIGVLVAAGLSSAALVVGGVIKFEAFPNVDGDVVEARVLLPQGTPLERTEAVTARLAEALAQVNDEFRPRQPDGQDLVRQAMVIFDRNTDANESGPHLATVVADLLTAEERDAPVDDVLARWREATGDVPGALAIKFTEPTYGPAGRPLEIRLSGNDLDQLKAASLELQAYLAGFDGVLNLFDDLRPGKPEFRLRLREGATGLGLTAQAVASQVRAAFFGSTARQIQVGGEAFDVDVRLAEAERSRITDLERFQVSLPDGSKV